MKSADRKGVVVALRPSSAAARRAKLEFLPAALEIVETPASPVGRAIAGTIILFFAIAIGWATFGHIDIIATASGKIVPTGRTKTIQPLEPGIVTAIRVCDGDPVSAGDVVIELDRTATGADRNRIAHDLLAARLDVARLSALRAGLDSGTGPVDFVPPDGAPDDASAGSGRRCGDASLQPKAEWLIVSDCRPQIERPIRPQASLTIG